MPFDFLFLLDDDTDEWPTLTPAPRSSRRRAPGPMGLVDPYAPPALTPAGRLSRRRAPGPVSPALPTDIRPVRPLPVTSRRRAPGPFIPSAADDDLIIVIAGGPASGAMHVVGYPNVTAAQAHPRQNDPGQGSFTTKPPGPAGDEVVGFTVAGRRVLEGYASTVTKTVRAQGEEAQQLHQVEVVGRLDDFRFAKVLPDFGARGPSRLGGPTQDVRIFDWTMNGAGAVDFGGTPLDLVPSVSMDATEAAIDGTFPLPDVWPDPWARWMWVHDPRIIARRGWCHFRVPTPLGGGTTHLWAAAHDYAEVWVDGVPMLICDTPGVAQRVAFDASRHHHNVTIRAYNERGRGAVLFSMLPVNADGLYDPPTMNSRSNWKCLAYTRRSFVSTPGQVLLRLRLEANERDVAGVGDWRFTFSGTRDSSGRPWPALDPIVADVGMSYLDVLNRLAEDRIDYAAAPAGKVLHAWVKDTGGVDRPTPWVQDVSMTSRTTKVAAR